MRVTLPILAIVLFAACGDSKSAVCTCSSGNWCNPQTNRCEPLLDGGRDLGADQSPEHDLAPEPDARHDQAVDVPRDRGADTATPDASIPCNQPAYSDNCSEVPYFQCGFGATCNGSAVTAQWHEHVLCGDSEQIVDFSCSYDCPNGCIDAQDWPASGAQLVQIYCKP